MHDLPIAHSDHRNKSVGVGTVAVDGVALRRVFQNRYAPVWVVVDSQVEAAVQMECVAVGTVEPASACRPSTRGG